MIAKTPKPPYYAVIFTTIRTEIEQNYQEMAANMHELASKQEGFLGMESARNEMGITVSYWQSLEAIRQWKQHTEHLLAQRLGREHWYKAYTTRVCLVEREYSFEKKRELSSEIF